MGAIQIMGVIHGPQGSLRGDHSKKKLKEKKSKKWEFLGIKGTVRDRSKFLWFCLAIIQYRY